MLLRMHSKGADRMAIDITIHKGGYLENEQFFRHTISYKRIQIKKPRTSVCEALACQHHPSLFSIPCCSISFNSCT
jgi:hypothetical protein